MFLYFHYSIFIHNNIYLYLYLIYIFLTTHHIYLPKNYSYVILILHYFAKKMNQNNQNFWLFSIIYIILFAFINKCNHKRIKILSHNLSYSYRRFPSWHQPIILTIYIRHPINKNIKMFWKICFIRHIK